MKDPSGRYETVYSIFNRASEVPEDELEAFLKEACGDDRELHAEVQELLGLAAEGQGGFLGEDHVVGARAALDAVADSVGETGPLEVLTEAGPYRELEKIGDGGMGVVYTAVHAISRQRVAVKTLRTGLGADQHLKRFHREVRVLGLLQHPGIAQIYDSGVVRTHGRVVPYYAMELVRGRALDAYANGLSLTVADRLELIARVCDALHLAHERGIVHRDLKPANILVDEASAEFPVDGGDLMARLGQPKILDFGVARTSSSELSAVTTGTLAGQLVGTIPYMSPEQARGESEALDRRSDVYSLGVVAFELLGGVLPYAVRGKAVHAAIRTICEQEPIRPRSLKRGLAGDVEAILLKALEKEPDRRYQSAAEFAEDLRRCNADLTVRARPVSRLYLASKFAKRNKALVAGVSGTIVATLAGAVVAIALSLVAQARAKEILRLSAQQDLAELVEEADRLWPPRPQMIPRYRAWISEVQSLVDGLPQHRAKRAELREEALSMGADAALAERRSHPLFERLLVLEAEAARLASGPSSGGALGPGGASVQELALEIEDLKRVIGERRTWTFRDSEAGRSAAWWHASLTRLIESLEGVSNVETGLLSEAAGAVSEVYGWSVPRRLRYAERLRDAGGEGAEWDLEWEAAARRVAAHPAYHGLVLRPQVGLVPIGPDPDSGLWEFWCVASGSEPVRGSEGRFIPAEEAGLVFVLIPAGKFWMGSSATEGSRNFDPDSRPEEGPVFNVSLSPYFISKYEMTQAQWAALTGVDPSFRTPETDENIVSRRHPVEQVSWAECVLSLGRFGLQLPTEAQWEHACRAGTGSPRPFGADDFAAHANTNDQAFERAVGERRPTTAPWDDGYFAHAPVGTFAPNAFGLHECLGNVWEWCRDGYREEFYKTASRVDPFFPPDGVQSRSCRGASFNEPPYWARSAARQNLGPDFASYTRGLRPARTLTQ